ncbi:hypothetical protein, partial [Stenotrophomonas maltophilia]|uniref:hypothetical protein n=1 Tax=Stenotrophomonas maltophilia TaxID=40324 RepID=UPI0019543B65
AVPVLEAFMATEMAETCRIVTPAEAQGRVPALRAEGLEAVLLSDGALRVESRTAIPKLARHLEEVHGVTIRRGVTVSAVEPP